jgi:hypothetical protein
MGVLEREQQLPSPVCSRLTLSNRAHLLQNLPAPEPVWCIQGAVTFRLYDQDVSLELPFDHSIFMKVGSMACNRKTRMVNRLSSLDQPSPAFPSAC